MSNNIAKKEVQRLKQRRSERAKTMKYRFRETSGRTVTLRDIRKKSSNNKSRNSTLTVQSSLAKPKTGVR